MNDGSSARVFFDTFIILKISSISFSTKFVIIPSDKFIISIFSAKNVNSFIICSSLFDPVAIKSTFVSFHLYSTLGIFTFAVFITSKTWGITSPDLIILTTLDGPILLSTIYLALNAVAFEIITPDNLVGSSTSFGFKYPSLDTFHSTSLTITSAVCFSDASLKANAKSGLPSAL